MKHRAVILAAGAFPKKLYPLYLLDSADVIVCCDSAAAAFRRHFGEDRLPDAVIGDLDSISPSIRRLYADRIVHITEQEDNDLTKALNWLLGSAPSCHSEAEGRRNLFTDIGEITILGATGKREDHTIGNLSLLMEYARTRGLDAFSTPSIKIVSDTCEAFALRDTATLYIGEGRSISVFSPDNSLQIRSEGLQWPLDNVVWDNWWKATLNRSTADSITLTFSHPSIALVILPA